MVIMLDYPNFSEGNLDAKGQTCESGIQALRHRIAVFNLSRSSDSTDERKRSMSISENFGNPNTHWEDKIPGMRAYTAEQVAETMEAAGFSDIQISSEKNMFCVNGTAK